MVRRGRQRCGGAVRDALASAGLSPADVGALFFVTVTGVATPSIDARLVNRMGLPTDIVRVPIFGLGCVAGAAGLAREDAEWLDEVALSRYDDLARNTPTGVEFDAAELGREPLPIRRRLVLQGLRTVAREREVEFAVVGPDAPIVAGLADRFEAAGVKVFAPSAKAAVLEGSKGFTKDQFFHAGVEPFFPPLDDKPDFAKAMVLAEDTLTFAGSPVLAVAEQMVEHTPGITRLLDRLERKRLVRRSRSTRDRRRVYCRITPEGAALVRLASHLGRPKGGPSPEFSLKPIAAWHQDIVVAGYLILGPMTGAFRDKRSMVWRSLRERFFM